MHKKTKAYGDVHTNIEKHYIKKEKNVTEQHSGENTSMYFTCSFQNRFKTLKKFRSTKLHGFKVSNKSKKPPEKYGTNLKKITTKWNIF